jgi:uncharacterized membrane protein (UPF0127 family)
MQQFVLVVAMLACACADSDGEPALLPTARITVSDGEVVEELTVELATTGPQHTQGLMFRQSLAEDRGMLFLFDQERSGGFWMKDTYVPLDIAYLAADGTVLEIREGVPLNTQILTPAQPYRHVLEVNRGWFERHNLGVGARVSIPQEQVAAAAETPLEEELSSSVARGRGAMPVHRRSAGMTVATSAPHRGRRFQGAEASAKRPLRTWSAPD